MSAIPFGARLRQTPQAEVEYEALPGVWKPATGANGVVTRAMLMFQHRDGLSPSLAHVLEAVRSTFVDPTTGT
jgi:hypothetical protein